MMDMATRVEVSHVRKRRDASGHEAIEGLGGVWLDRPWSMSAQNVIWEIGRPDGERQWDFFVVIDRANVRITVAKIGGRKHLMAAGEPVALLNLPGWQASDDRTIPS
jgi:hypothetical protein